MNGWSPSVTTAASTSPSAATPACSDADWPSAQSVAHDDVGAAEVDLLADRVGVGAEDDDDRVDRGHGEHRADRVLEQRAAVELGDLLGAAEALALAGGEHDAADLRLGLCGSRRAGHAGTPSSISSASASSEAIELPGRRWSTCGSAACMPRVSGS